MTIRTRKSAKKDETKQAAATLRHGGGSYVQARTRESKERAANLKQLRQMRARELISAVEVNRAFALIGGTLRTRLTAVAKSLRAKHPGLPEELFVEVERQHAEALSQAADTVDRLIERGDVDDDEGEDRAAA